MSATSLTDSFPPEILARIFIHVVSKDHSHRFSYHSHLFGEIEIQKFSRRNTGSAGSQLGQVCRRWRDISLSTPALWSSIWAEVKPQSYSSITLDWVKMYLERSRSYPLTMTIWLGNFPIDEPHPEPFSGSEDSDSPDDFTTASSLCDLILDHASRIQHLSLKFDHTPLPTFAQQFVSKLQASLDGLRDLVFLTDGDSAVYLLEAFSSPHLYSIVLGNYRWRNQTPSQPQRLHKFHITTLEIVEANIQSISTLLPHFPHLRSATVSLFTRSPRVPNNALALPDSVPTLSLAHLTELNLGLSYLWAADPFTTLLQSLDTPSLTHLCFRGTPYRHSRRFYHASELPTFIQAITTFIGRHPDIDTLRLFDVPLVDDVLLTTLAGLRRLALLDVIDVHGYGRAITNRFFNELASVEVVPVLKDLRLVMRQSQYEKGVIEKMLQRRTLRSVYLMVEESVVPVLDLQCLRELQRQGLALRVVASKCKFGDSGIEVLGYEIE